FFFTWPIRAKGVAHHASLHPRRAGDHGDPLATRFTETRRNPGAVGSPSDKPGPAIRAARAARKRARHAAEAGQSLLLPGAPCRPDGLQENGGSSRRGLLRRLVVRAHRTPDQDGKALG